MLRGIALTSMACLIPSLASAQILSHYVANAVPTPPAFGPWPFNGGIETTPLADDQGRGALQIQNTGASVQQAYYTMLGGSGPFGSSGLGSGLTTSQAGLLAAQGFTLTILARVVQGPTLGATGLFSVDASVAGFNGFRYDIQLGSDGNGNTTVVLPTVIAFDNVHFTGFGAGDPLILPGNAYHLYQLSFDPAAQAATLYIDGVGRRFGYPGSAVGGGATAGNYGLVFGVANDATGAFADVQLAVPEPGGELALWSGALALALFRVRRDRSASISGQSQSDDPIASNIRTAVPTRSP
jgi:hypothetical protein